MGVFHIGVNFKLIFTERKYAITFGKAPINTL